MVDRADDHILFSHTIAQQNFMTKLEMMYHRCVNDFALGSWMTMHVVWCEVLMLMKLSMQVLPKARSLAHACKIRRYSQPGIAQQLIRSPVPCHRASSRKHQEVQRKVLMAFDLTISKLAS